MEQLTEILKETAIFMVAAQMLLHFLPGKKYEKYGKMTVALVVFSQLAVPVLSLSGQEAALSFQEKMDALEAQNEMFTQRLEGMEADQGRMAENGLLLSVEERLEQEASAAGVRVETVRSDGQTVIIEVRSAEAEKKGVKVEPAEVEKIRVDGQTKNVDAGASRGRKRADLAGVFAKKLGMEEEKLEVIELE